MSTTLSLLIAALWCDFGAAAEVPKTAPRSIILFGASWCAPCLIELRDLPQLAAAAAPDRLVLAWTDRKADHLLATRPATVELMPPAEARHLLEGIAGNASGLPHSIMLDGAGKPCAEWRAPLTPVAISSLRASCR